MSSILIAGDIFPSKDNQVLFESGDAKALFGDYLLELFSKASFSIANLEGALTDCSDIIHKVGPSLKASPKSINVLKTLGLSAVALANNHVTDYLQKGVSDTIAALESVGMQHIGASVDEIAKSITVEINGKRICIFNVSETFFNFQFVNLYDEYEVCKELNRLKSMHDYLIVIYHGGTENYPYPTPSIYKRFHRMADNGADFITAQHTHCIGCEEWYNGSYLLYGQGNFLFARMNGKNNRQGLVTEINFSSDDIAIKHHQVFVNDHGTLNCPENQNLDDFYERSHKITETSFIQSNYRSYIANNTKLQSDYIQSYRGKSIEGTLLKKLFPNYFQKWIRRQYSEKHLLRILLSLQSDRTGENVLCMWEKIYHELYDKG